MTTETAIMDPPGTLMRAERMTAPTPIDAYLWEIGQTRLLTAEQETTLARRVEQGDSAAADDLARANLRLVVSVARRYLNHGLPLEDLISEGNMGLLHAVQKYDWRRGCRFSTYAVWWIRQAMHRAIDNQARMVHVPVHVSDSLAKRARAVARLTIELGREPTCEEVDAVLGADAPVSALDVVAAQAPLSLQMEVGEDGEEHLIDAMPDKAAVIPEEGATHQIAAEEIRQVLAEALTARERAVLTLHFGLNGSPPECLEVVGRRLGMTRERVRQLEATAIRKLRRPAVAARLRTC